jgi:hypothetical protein
MFIDGFDGLTQLQAGFNGFTFYPPDVQQQQQRHPLQSIVPNNVLPIPSQPNVHPSPQTGPFRP